jgi:hypothetical protein
MYRATYYSEREDTQVLNLMLMKSKAEFNGSNFLKGEEWILH